MIQRIQSIFLAVCTIIFFLFIFMPLKQVVKDGVPVNITSVAGFNKNFSYTFTYDTVSAFCFIGMAAAAIAIFCYKQRYLQIRFCYILVGIAILCLSLLNFTSATNGFASFESVPMLTNVLFALVLVCSFLAVIFIKKDINLLKKADRLR